jgi:uncharacterized membrane protein YkoI
MTMNLNRRFLIFATLCAVYAQASPSFADDESSSDDGKDSEDSQDSGNSNTGSSNSGNSKDDDERDDEDSEKVGISPFGLPNSQVKRADHDRALKAVERGKAASLRELKLHLDRFYPGRILNVKFTRSSGHYFYNVRILGSGNRIRNIKLNALTLKPKDD